LTDWLGLCRATVEDVRGVLVELPLRSDREPVVGSGKGGDETTAIDAAAERAILARFEKVDGVTIVSEEAGVIGDGATFVVIDPIDGSLNAKRGIGFLRFRSRSHPVKRWQSFGFVHDFGTGESGRRRAWGAPRGPPLGRLPKGRSEILAFEATRPPRSPRRPRPSSISPTACGSWAPWRSRCVTWPPAVSTPSARSSRRVQWTSPPPSCSSSSAASRSTSQRAVCGPLDVEAFTRRRSQELRTSCHN
jgi:hypothetical protein